MDKRGWTYVSSRSKLSLILGILCTSFGILPLLSLVNIAIPGFSFINLAVYDLIVKIALFVGGVFLLYDSFAVRSMMTGRISGASIIAGLFLAILGAIPLALHFKLLNFLPFVVELNIPSPILYGLLIFYGIYLMVDAFIVRDTRF